jgi:diguanylate cyclase (GGDEF)-like protein/PAS domain S-box-containing protein
MMTYAKGNVRYADGLFSDITRQKRAEEALRISEERYRTLVKNIPDVTWTADAQLNPTFVSNNVPDIFGFTAEELVSGGFAAWRDSINPADVAPLAAGFKVLFEENKPLDMEFRITRRDGAQVWVHGRASSTYVQDGIKYADGMFTDITKQKTLEAQLAHQASHDPLTGLANRRIFEESLNRAISRARRGTPSGLLTFDVDHFKQINDQFGHATGDDTLVGIARAVLSMLRTEDVLARLGGDEFAVLLDGADAAKTLEVAERMRRLVSESPKCVDGHAQPTLSIGVVEIEGDTTVQGVMSVADIAMYQAKDRGRNQVVVRQLLAARAGT